MKFTAEYLYSLLPEIDRSRDFEQGEPLKALLAIIAEQIGVLEDNLDQLYDDLFIETCAEWVVPYIADLLGVRLPHAVPGAQSLRAYVAKTIRYRQRKGTAALLPEIIHDVTGWDVLFVEFFRRLAMSQFISRPRPFPPTTVDLRNRRALERRDTPFDESAHTIDVRRMHGWRGRYNVRNVGIFVWRLRPYPVSRSPAVPVDGDGVRYRFSPLGNDIPLFHRPKERSSKVPVDESMAPVPISRGALRDNLGAFYGRGGSIFIEVDGVPVEVAGNAQRVVVKAADLSDDGTGGWRNVPKRSDDQSAARTIVIDPELGRFALQDWQHPESVLVTYHYGFSADLGGGEYARSVFVDETLEGADVKSVPSPQYPTIADAWNWGEGSKGGVIEITDSGRHAVPNVIAASEKQHIVLRAQNEHAERRYCRPVLQVDGSEGAAAPDAAQASPDELEITMHPNSQVTLEGLLIAGRGLRIVSNGDPKGGDSTLRLRHCTLVPGRSLTLDGSRLDCPPSLTVAQQPEDGTLTIEIDHCILGPMRLPTKGIQLVVRDSIIDGLSDETLAIGGNPVSEPGPPAIIERATIIGRVHVWALTLANAVLFAGKVEVERRQVSCVRFCALPDFEHLLHRYRCEPLPGDALRPYLFTSRRYGEPGYCQLGRHCPSAISEGAEDGLEIGAFNELWEPRRKANLQLLLREYLPVLDAGVFYET